MTFCLMPDARNRFTSALRSGTIDPYKLNQLSSDERRSIFKQVIGDDETAKQVNTAFESRMLLKNQKYAYTNWAKKVAGITPDVRRDMVSRIEKLDHVLDPQEETMFLKDLAASRLGFGVTQEEAKNISNLSKAVTTTKEKVGETGTFKNDTDRLAYGMSKVNLENYVSDLKVASRMTATKNPVRLAGRALKATPGFLKSSVSTFDNSFFGRQGIKSLLNIRSAPTWTKNFLKSWKDIGRELGGKNDTLDLIKADIYSRPNAMNGKYAAGKYGLDTLTEEAYPSHAPEKIPLFGRLFKASEAAYNGGALRMRTDLADKFIARAEKQDIDTLDKKQAEGIGTLVGSMTGRGSLDRANSQVNTLLFSPKFLKSNINSLTLHAFDKKATAFTRKEAAKNLAGIVTTIGSVLTVAHALNPKSVELDPRSANFGKIKIFSHWTDISGGMGSLVTLASRLVPTENKGNIGFYRKSGSGNINSETSGDFGSTTALDTLDDFWQGKLAPAPGVLRDVWQGQNYNEQKPTVRNETEQTTIPLSIQNYSQFKDGKNADLVGSMILDGLGFSVSSPPQSNRNNLPNASPKLVNALNNVQYNTSTPSQSQRGQTLTKDQYQKFVTDRNGRFTQAVNKALNQNKSLDKTRLSVTMTHAQNKALDDLRIKKFKKTVPKKSY